MLELDSSKYAGYISPEESIPVPGPLRMPIIYNDAFYMFVI